MSMKLVLAALVFALATACSSGSAPPPEDFAPAAAPAPGNFRLYVSNQSFDRPTVDIEVFIDGVRLARRDFEVRGQHNWIEFGAELTAGEHQLRAVSEDGKAELKKSFNTGAKNWAVLDYWCCGEPDDPKFTFSISDKPVAFA